MVPYKTYIFLCSCGQTENIFFCKVAVLPSPLATSEGLDPTPSENYSGADFFCLKKYHQKVAPRYTLLTLLTPFTPFTTLFTTLFTLFILLTLCTLFTLFTLFTLITLVTLFTLLNVIEHFGTLMNTIEQY